MDGEETKRRRRRRRRRRPLWQTNGFQAMMSEERKGKKKEGRASPPLEAGRARKVLAFTLNIFLRVSGKGPVVIAARYACA